MAGGRSATRDRLVKGRWIGVVREKTNEAGRRAAENLFQGGCPAIEITMTTPGAIELIRGFSGRGEPLVGAGTVLDAAQAAAAAAAGARFLIAPVAPAEVLEAGHAAGLPVVLAGLTPGELHAAHRAGSDLVKVFPVGPVGGPDYIRVVLGPLRDLPLVATGGIADEDIPAYFAAGAVMVGVARPWPDVSSVETVRRVVG